MSKIKVVILCGGGGRRLRPLTSKIPKPLVKLNNRPILQHILEFYIAKGIDEFILCTGFKSDMIRKLVSSIKFQAKIKIDDLGAHASIIERLYSIRNLIGERAVVAYGDTFMNIDIKRMIEEHIRTEAKITMTVADIRSPFGLVKINSNNDVIEFEEKPLLPHYIGHFVMERNIFDDFDNNLIGMPDGEGLILLFRRLISEGKLKAYRHFGLQITFNTLHEYHKAEEDFINFFTQQEGKV